MLASISAAEVRFVDVAAAAGIDFSHVNGMVGESWLVEIMGAGAAVFDFDGDGRMDIWLVQGGPLADREDALREAAAPCDRLYRNVGKVGELKFVDWTAESGFCARGYGMGIATGDTDNDGDLDVFLANYGANQLVENLGDGRFRPMPGGDIAGEGWSVSASFADIDGDGWLDLYVANYVTFALADHTPCTDAESRPSYCSPEVYPPARDRLYRNVDGGRFADISATGIDGKHGAGLGVVAEDFDGDGATDLFVANDMTDNLLWINQGGGKFANTALLAGVAVNGAGSVEAGMGVDAADFDGDCDADLFLTHLAVQTNTLYVNDGRGWFTDRSNVAGVAARSTPYTGFGTGWFDADNDGDFDLFSANGAVTAVAGQAPGPLGLPLRQPNQFWRNDGGRYVEEPAGNAFAVMEVSRGAAFGDLDNDGDLDIVVTNNNGPARLYRNDSDAGHWLGAALVGDAGNPQTTGSLAWLESAPCQRRRVATDGSYASAHDPRVLFGLGADVSKQHVVVRWPDGREQRFGPLAPNRYHILRRRTTAGD